VCEYSQLVQTHAEPLEAVALPTCISPVIKLASFYYSKLILVTTLKTINTDPLISATKSSNEGNVHKSGRSQSPRSRRRNSAAKSLLGSWVRIPPAAWIFCLLQCFSCQVEVSAKGRSLFQRSPTDCGVCLNVIK
jgi:hypothetical protein